MSEQSNEETVGGIRDEDLPEDVRPSDDNPLAKNPDDSGEESPKLPGTPDVGEAPS